MIFEALHTVKEFSVKIKQYKRFVKSLDNEAKRWEKNLINAAKVEGFRLMKLMRQEISAGAPGGEKFTPMRNISNYLVAL